jgi:Animal haem peroxidase
MSGFGHGNVGTREQAFTELLPLRAVGYPTDLLYELADFMKGDPDTVKDGADAEENLLLPAGYTYFGQFIDHDLTFDNTSSLNPADMGKEDRFPSNLRTPRFDLDSLYGDGPDAQPFMYDDNDGASLLFKEGDKNKVPVSTNNPEIVEGFANQADEDLLRSPNGRAIIGDKRNDENSIISQIQLSFVKFHNKVVEKLKTSDLTGTALFEAARKEVRWAYQKLVIEDFLPRIVKGEVFEDLKTAKTPANRSSCYALYTEDKRINLPREFVVAAYRFGHSGVRFGYRLNHDNDPDNGKPGRFSIFASSKDPSGKSLLGFDPLRKIDVIDNWSRFFPNTTPLNIPPGGLGDPPIPNPEDPDGDIPNPAIRLQFAYKLDTTLVDPLTVLPPSVLPTSPNPKGAIQEVKDAINPKSLPDIYGRPSLALLNLLRGNNYRVQSGQEIAKILQGKGFRQNDCDKPEKKDFPIEPLDTKYLVVRKKVDKGGKTFFKFEPIDSKLLTDTPLWFYVLAEAQARIVDKVRLESDGTFDEGQLTESDIAQTQLGWVGGRVVAEVFYGLMDSDLESYVYKEEKDPTWKPIWVDGSSVSGDQIIFANLLKFAGQTI